MNGHVLTNLAALAVFASSAAAAPYLDVQIDVDDPFLVERGLMSATVSITGFEDGQSVMGIIGVATNPFIVSTTSSEGFYNTDSLDPFWNGNQPFAGDPALEEHVPGITYDSGFLPPVGTPSPFGHPQGDGNNDVWAFAREGDGGNTNAAPFFWIALAFDGIRVDSSTVFPVLRLTWAATESANVGLVFVMDSPSAEHNLFVEIPPVPSPGGLLALGLAGAIGARRRRRCVRRGCER